MISLTSEQDKNQLREYAYALLKDGKLEGLSILVEVFNEKNLRLFPDEIEMFFELALYDDNLPLLKYIVEQDETVLYTKGDMALREAAYIGNLEMVKYLVEHKANIHAYKEHALRNAVSEKHLEIVKYLVENGADIHISDGIILTYATSSGCVKLISYLLEQGINPRAEDNFPIKIAVEQQRLDIITLLIEKGACVDTAREIFQKMKFQNPSIKSYLDSLPYSLT